MTLTVISLGAGVQSTTMALMAAHGEFTPMPDCAIFADTGWEPKKVYDHLDWLEANLPFPIHRVSQGDLREDLLSGTNSDGGKFSVVPWFTINADGTKGMGRRQCTSEYKLRPIMRKVRELLGGKTPKGGCETWIGISTDEMTRMKDARVQYIVNRFPLIEANISRRNCLEWMRAREFPEPPKSACLGCPFHSDAMWRDLRDNDPIGWADAIQVDKEIRETDRGQQFMHAARVPLDEVDLSTPEDRGQLNFLSECEGMCGI
jgi:hypothetical protein